MRTIEEVVKEIEERLRRPYREIESDIHFRLALQFVFNFIHSDPPCLHKYFTDADVLMPGTYIYCPECGQNMKENHADNGKL